MDFTGHGSFSIRVEGNVLWATFHSQWNLETYLEYRKRLVELTGQNGLEYPINVIDIRNWGLAGPEVFSTAQDPDFIPSRIEHGLRHVIFVFDRQFSGALMQSYFSKFLVPQYYVHTPEEAETLIRRLGGEASGE